MSLGACLLPLGLALTLGCQAQLPAPTPLNSEALPPPTVTYTKAEIASSAPKANAELLGKLRSVAERYPDLTIGAAVLDLNNGDTAAIKGDRSFPMASVFKLPVMIEVARQMQEGETELDLDSQLTITNSTKCIGSGTLYKKPNGSTVSLDQAIEDMITVSDNTATDLILSHIGTRAVNRLLWSHNLKHSSVYMSNRQAWLLSLRYGVPHGESVSSFLSYWKTLNIDQKFALAEQVGKKGANLTAQQLQALEDKSEANETYAQSVAMARAVDNLGSPNDYNRLLAMLWKRQILNDDWSEYCLGVLSRQQYNNRLPALLPQGTKTYHKTGTITGVVNDSGIVMVAPQHPVAISVFVEGIPQGRSAAATKAISEISLAAYRYCLAK